MIGFRLAALGLALLVSSAASSARASSERFSSRIAAFPPTNTDFRSGTETVGA